jgi:hypothetical protein
MAGRPGDAQISPYPAIKTCFVLTEVDDTDVELLDAVFIVDVVRKKVITLGNRMRPKRNTGTISYVDW